MPRARASLPSTCPHALSNWLSQDEAMAVRLGGAVVCLICAPPSTLTPCASVQQSGAIAGVVPAGASTEPIVPHRELGANKGTDEIPCRSRAAFCNCCSVGGFDGNNCCSSRLTVGVNGAPAANPGDVTCAGSGPSGEYPGGSAIADEVGATTTAAAVIATRQVTTRRRCILRGPL